MIKDMPKIKSFHEENKMLNIEALHTTEETL